MTHYDLIVCGAGPAGAMAAATAAQQGLRVALLEKYPLPRHKTCGGGTPMVMQSFLKDLVPTAFVECDVTHMRHTWRFDDPHLAAINPPGTEQRLSIWMMQRAVFDQALVERAARAGATVMDGLTVQAVEPETDGVRVRGRTHGQTVVLTAPYVIGADGANGVTVKATKLRQNRAIALGMEIELPHTWGSSGHPDLRPEVAHLEYGAVQRGYAWIFPKGDHLNIGAGRFRPGVADARGDRAIREELRQAIFGYLAAMDLPYDAAQLRFHAHPLPGWTGKEPLHTPDGRILLAGDAAGLINPLFGDGILHAVKSGIIAAQCVSEGQTQTYSDRIHQTFGNNFDAALKLAQVFYRYPYACYQFAVKRPQATRLATRLLADDLAFSDVAQKAMRRLRRRLLTQFWKLPFLANSSS